MKTASLRGRANPFLTCSDVIKQAQTLPIPAGGGGGQSLLVAAPNKGHGVGKWDYGMNESERKNGRSHFSVALAEWDQRKKHSHEEDGAFRAGNRKNASVFVFPGGKDLWARKVLPRVASRISPNLAAAGNVSEAEDRGAAMKKQR